MFHKPVSGCCPQVDVHKYSSMAIEDPDRTNVRLHIWSVDHYLGFAPPMQKVSLRVVSTQKGFGNVIKTDIYVI